MVSEPVEGIKTCRTVPIWSYSSNGHFLNTLYPRVASQKEKIKRARRKKHQEETFRTKGAVMKNQPVGWVERGAYCLIWRRAGGSVARGGGGRCSARSGRRRYYHSLPTTDTGIHLRLNQPINLSENESTHQSIREWINPLIYYRMNQPINLSELESIYQSIKEWINPSFLSIRE